MSTTAPSNARRRKDATFTVVAVTLGREDRADLRGIAEDLLDLMGEGDAAVTLDTGGLALLRQLHEVTGAVLATAAKAGAVIPAPRPWQ